MNKTFENLSEEKKLRIINSAIEEFANKGYKRATVDNIVSKAGISKGSIFQYFKNKERLYLYICDYQIKIITDEVFKQKENNGNDFFKLYKQAARVKFEILKKNPYIFKFFKTLYSDDSQVAQKWLENILKNKDQLVLNFIGDYDKSKFRDDIDIDMAIKTIELTFDGLSMKWMDKLSYENYESDLKSLFEEVENYINFYKKLYYKGEN
ncbi:TetR family transcriptional regulator [[Clostridium] sordellii]|uniref:TetR-family transcriptional regulator n=1 Tax=Paraclostridium sordellii TaxID=1505 RepID=A0ABP1XPJ1_PARSO|nr:TetR/AcrR family transcriptional regulator [Paeniclostridium sordellii]EPZ58883.1 bacterial regulatory s, tetR family protein [[Clostridium] sordellii ATCC 9714] [Paeniclostridium sordellii ATCC 9714]CEJ73104.1 TetR-family transcriptional regulator [[Clostridium] sordellii] [Paeniclostridium sordellii]CEN68657.1 TetR family transcriptional regulator [[Clostridium] sordellii] [Paeniclostridium sordellii]CEN71924.1 TetR family transcriptional regulator [[Clostridium] sordellii] [Paeniclostridi